MAASWDTHISAKATKAHLASKYWEQRSTFLLPHRFRLNTVKSVAVRLEAPVVGSAWTQCRPRRTRNRRQDSGKSLLRFLKLLIWHPGVVGQPYQQGSFLSTVFPRRPSQIAGTRFFSNWSRRRQCPGCRLRCPRPRHPPPASPNEPVPRPPCPRPSRYQSARLELGAGSQHPPHSNRRTIRNRPSATPTCPTRNVNHYNQFPTRPLPYLDRLSRICYTYAHPAETDPSIAACKASKRTYA